MYNENHNDICDNNNIKNQFDFSLSDVKSDD